MKKVIVPSFQIDHTTLDEGLYLREVRKLNLFTKIKVWDLRFVAPRTRTSLTAKVLHSIEHLMAFGLRERLGEKYISFCVMGCKTGFTFISKNSLTKEELVKAVKGVINYNVPLVYKSDIPALTPKECGNPSLYDLEGTNDALKKYLKVLENLS